MEEGEKSNEAIEGNRKYRMKEDKWNRQVDETQRWRHGCLLMFEKRGCKHGRRTSAARTHRPLVFGSPPNRLGLGFVHLLEVCAISLEALGAPPEVLLVLLALGVGEVAALGLVNGEAQAAFQLAQVVLDQVRVVADVGVLQCQLPQAFAAGLVQVAPGGDPTGTRS